MCAENPSNGTKHFARYQQTHITDYCKHAGVERLPAERKTLSSKSSIAALTYCKESGQQNLSVPLTVQVLKLRTGYCRNRREGKRFSLVT